MSAAGSSAHCAALCFCAWCRPLSQPGSGFNDGRWHLPVNSHRIYFSVFLFFFRIALYGKDTCSLQKRLGNFFIFCEAETADILGCVCKPVFFRE